MIARCNAGSNDDDILKNDKIRKIISDDLNSDMGVHFT